MFDEAKQALEKSSSVGANAGKENKNVAKLMRECDIQMDKIRQAEKAMYQKMFKKMDVANWKTFAKSHC